MNSTEVKDLGPTNDVDRAEQIRRRFAEAWSQMGASWGIAPSTAAVQGYLLAHGGPVTDAELQQALGLSHRAIRLALQSCIEWGIVPWLVKWIRIESPSVQRIVGPGTAPLKVQAGKRTPGATSTSTCFASIQYSRSEVPSRSRVALP